MFAGLWARGFALECRSATSLVHLSRHGSSRLLHQTLPKPTSLPSLAGNRVPTWSTLSAFRKTGLWSPSRNLALRPGGVPRRAFDPRFFSSNAAEIPASELPVLSPPAVGGWLVASAALVFAVIVVGGVTRLTESGLSITEWRPIAGILPPLTKAEWEKEFDKYKATPEFKLYVDHSPSVRDLVELSTVLSTQTEPFDFPRRVQGHLLYGVGSPRPRSSHRYRLHRPSRLLRPPQTAHCDPPPTPIRHGAAHRRAGCTRLVHGQVRT